MAFIGEYLTKEVHDALIVRPERLISDDGRVFEIGAWFPETRRDRVVSVFCILTMEVGRGEKKGEFLENVNKAIVLPGCLRAEDERTFLPSSWMPVCSLALKIKICFTAIIEMGG